MGVTLQPPVIRASARYNRPMIEASVVHSITARLSRALAAPQPAYRPLWVEDAIVGWLDDARAERLALFTDAFVVDSHRITFQADIETPQARTAVLDQVSATLAAEGALTAWRNERYAVADRF